MGFNSGFTGLNNNTHTRARARMHVHTHTHTHTHTILCLTLLMGNANVVDCLFSKKRLETSVSSVLSKNTVIKYTEL